MRLFFALEIPAAQRQSLATLRPRGGAPGARELRWVAPELFHVTLAFLGEQPESLLPALTTAGHAAAATGHRGILRLGAPSSFAKRGAPQVLWVGLEGHVDILEGLHASLVQALQSAGIPFDPGPFRPHVTIARARVPGRPVPGFQWPPAPDTVRRDPFPLDSFALVRSHLGSAGPRYELLERFALSLPSDQP